VGKSIGESLTAGSLRGELTEFADLGEFEKAKVYKGWKSMQGKIGHFYRMAGEILEGTHPVVKELDTGRLFRMQSWCAEYLRPDQRPTHRQRALSEIQRLLAPEEEDSAAARKWKRKATREAEKVKDLQHRISDLEVMLVSAKEAIASLETESRDVSRRSG